MLLGQIKDAGDVLHLALGYLEHLLKGIHLINGNDAIGFRHLGAQHNHAHGECHLALRRPILLPTYRFAP